MKIKLLKLTVFGLFTFLTAMASAQNGQCSGFTITNSNLPASCLIQVNYQIECASPFAICSTGSFTLNGNSSATVPNCPCAGGTTSCNIIVTITSVNGSTAGLPVSVDFNNPNNTYPSTCSGAGNVNWSSSGVVIN